MNEMHLMAEGRRESAVTKLLHKGNSPRIFMSYPSNFFAQHLLFGQSGDNPEGFRLPVRVCVTSNRGGNAGEF
jgi:hypothetical protein